MNNDHTSLPHQPVDESPVLPAGNVQSEVYVSSPLASCRHRTPWILIVGVGLISGIVGGLASRGGALPHWLSGMPREEIATVQEESATSTPLPAEDEKIVGVIEESTKAVVSIVITKDVPKYRSFRSPFGNFFPFFQEDLREDTGTTERQQVGSGSGFLVSADGYVVTNKHVVSDTAAEYTVIMSNDQEYSAKVLAMDPNNDIAVLKIEGNNLPSLSLGDSDRIRVGQTVIAIGNPLGEFANSASRGIISGLGREVTAGSSFGQSETLRDIIQTDAAINPGNSGGPLLNINGQVIGINVAVAQGAENIGFALPVNSIKRVVDEVKTTGKLSTPYIGVRYILLDEATAKEYGLSVTSGALVLRGERMTDLAVIPGSPADKAGIIENDIILEVDGKKVDVDHPLAKLTAEKRVGDEVTLKVWHKGDIKEVKLRLEERKQ